MEEPQVMESQSTLGIKVHIAIDVLNKRDCNLHRCDPISIPMTISTSQWPHLHHSDTHTSKRRNLRQSDPTHIKVQCWLVDVQPNRLRSTRIRRSVGWDLPMCSDETSKRSTRTLHESDANQQHEYRILASRRAPGTTPCRCVRNILKGSLNWWYSFYNANFSIICCGAKRCGAYCSTDNNAPAVL